MTIPVDDDYIAIQTRRAADSGKWWIMPVVGPSTAPLVFGLIEKAGLDLSEMAPADVGDDLRCFTFDGEPAIFFVRKTVLSINALLEESGRQDDVQARGAMHRSPLVVMFHPDDLEARHYAREVMFRMRELLSD
jgi:hypothetical protein